MKNHKIELLYSSKMLTFISANSPKWCCKPCHKQSHKLFSMEVEPLISSCYQHIYASWGLSTVYGSWEMCSNYLLPPYIPCHYIKKPTISSYFIIERLIPIWLRDWLSPKLWNWFMKVYCQPEVTLQTLWYILADSKGIKSSLVWAKWKAPRSVASPDIYICGCIICNCNNIERDTPWTTT